jgi:hypothetical protein
MFGLSLIRRSTVDKLVEAYTVAQRQLEDLGWINVTMSTEDQSRLTGEDFKKMVKRCRLAYVMNPLAGHWVHLTTYFVFGEGLSKPKSKEPQVQEVIDKFWDDPDNRMTLTTYHAQKLLSNKIQYEGNLFFVLFPDAKGDVRVRIMNIDEVMDMVKDTEDKMRVMFYKTSSVGGQYDFNSDQFQPSARQIKYYADISNPDPASFNIPSNKYEADVYIFHVKINCDINDRFGIPDLYRGLDWIAAHKSMAADLATLIKSLSQLAWKKKVKGNTAQVNALKTAMNAKQDFTNKGPAAGSVQIENEAIDTQPINTPTGGVKIGTDGLKAMQLQVCAASDMFYHYYGDPETGNLATTTSMELPMIKKFAGYQKFWEGVINEILQFVINQKVEMGLLPGKVEMDEKNKRKVYTVEFDRAIDIDFPPIIEKDLQSLATALTAGKNGRMVGDETAARIFLQALGQNNIDEELANIDFSKPEEVLMPDGTIVKKPVQPGMPGYEEFGKRKEDAPPAKGEEKPVKEAGPSRSEAVKHAAKTNYVLQRMNGYKRALGAAYKDFKKHLREHTQHVTVAGKTVGNVDQAMLVECLAKLENDMNKAAEQYYPIAIGIGKSYVQSHLPRNKILESLTEAGAITERYLKEKIASNTQFISESLVPDLSRKIMETVKLPYEGPEQFEAAMAVAVDAFDSRVNAYVGAFWTVEEGAVKEFGSGTGLMVNFVGADDDASCEGCLEAMAGNPYPIEDAPEPGDHECRGNCRHALQIIESEQK